MTDPLARLDEIQARADAATAGPWEYGDRYHIQGASHCTCSPEYGPLVADKPMDINGEMMRVHVHRRDEPFWPHGIYSPTDEGPLAVVYDGDGRVLDEQDAEFIAAARADVPRLVAGARAILERHAPTRYPSLGDTLYCGCCMDGWREPELFPCPEYHTLVAALGWEP